MRASSGARRLQSGSAVMLQLNLAIILELRCPICSCGLRSSRLRTRPYWSLVEDQKAGDLGAGSAPTCRWWAFSRAGGQDAEHERGTGG